MMSCMVSAPGCRQPRAQARASPLCRSSARQCGFSRAHAGRPRGLLLVRESRMTRQWSQPPDRLVALAATFPVSIGFFDLSPNYPMELFQTQCLWGFAQRVFDRLFSPSARRPAPAHARAWFSSVPAAEHLRPMLPLADAANEVGHEVAFLTDAGKLIEFPPIARIDLP